MPIIDTTGIRPIERREPTESTERVRRRDEGGGFRPQTNVNLKAAIKDIAATLGKIGTEEKTGLQKLPKEVGEVVKNILQQSLSIEATLGKGIGSTVESQRFSMEQLMLFSRMLIQIGSLAERGYSMKLSDETQALLSNFKNAIVAEEGGENFEPVLMTKAAFELVDAKTADQLPQALYEILSQLSQMPTVTQQQPQQSESMQFLKQLIKFFMPRPGVDFPIEDAETEGSQNQQGQKSQSATQRFLASMFRNPISHGQPTQQGTFTQQSNQQGNFAQSTNQQGQFAQPTNQQGQFAQPSNQQGQFAQPTNQQGNFAQPTNQQGQFAQPSNQQGQFAQPSNQQGNFAQPTNQQGQFAQPTNQQGQFAQPTNQQGQFAQPSNQQGQFAQPTNQQGQFAQPTNQQGNFAQPTNQQGQFAQPTNQQGQFAQQTNRQGQFAQPTNQQGQFAQPTNRQGQFAQPTNQQGNFAQPTNQQGNFAQPTNQQGQLAQPTNQQGNFAQPTNQQGQFAQPTNQQGQFAQPTNQQGQFAQPTAQGQFAQPTNQQGQFAQQTAQSQFAQPTNQQGQFAQPTNQQGQFAQPTAQGQFAQPTNQQGQFAQQTAQSQFAQPTNQQGQFAQPTNQQGQFAQSTNQQGQFTQSTNQQGQFAQPTNQQGQFTQSTNQQGQFAQPTNQQGQFAQPTNQQGQFSQPTNQQGNLAQPTNQQGQFAQPTNQQGNLAQPTNQQGQFAQPTNQQGQFAQPTAQGQPTRQSRLTQPPQPAEILQDEDGQKKLSEEFIARQKEMREVMKASKAELIKNNWQNTPQTIDTMKGLAQFLMRGTQITPRDFALLQNFVNNSQEMMPELEARHLQNLLRLCQNNLPMTVQQAAVQQNLPDLPRLWAFMQMCDLARLNTSMNAKAFKRAGRDVADFATNIRRAMTSDNAIIQNQRSFQMMMPIYLGENAASYPTYLSVYDENERDEETGENRKETWLRICVLTDHIGAAELVFRIYNQTELDLRFYFSRRDIAEEFRSIYLEDLKDSINNSSALTVGEVRVGGGSERMFSF